MTNNQIIEVKGDFLTNPQLLNSGIVRKYLDPQGKASDEELAYFIAHASCFFASVLLASVLLAFCFCASLLLYFFTSLLLASLLLCFLASVLLSFCAS